MLAGIEGSAASTGCRDMRQDATTCMGTAVRIMPAWYQLSFAAPDHSLKHNNDRGLEERQWVRWSMGLTCTGHPRLGHSAYCQLVHVE